MNCSKIKINKNVEKPLISIITVVLNNEKYIQKTLDSIFKQTYKNYELIVIDGGSEDNTLNIIKKNRKKINFWISEKDKGIYDAFNKGLKYASGDYIGFVNSDDILLPNTIKILTKYIRLHPEKDFFFGAVKKHWGVLHGYKPWKIYFSWGFYSSHSTKKKMKGIGTKEKEVFGIFRRGGYSSTISFKEHFKEEIQIRRDNGQSFLILAIIIIYKSIKNFKRLIFLKN
jgi:glycosyltransferase involved in cell wall biosynthesis